MNAKFFKFALLLASMTIGAAAGADAEHKESKPADHSKMDHSAMQEHWSAPPPMARRKNPMVADAASLARGKQIFDTNCASCHGATGKGDGPAAQALNPKPAALAVMAPQHAPGDLAWKIETGRGPMPAWKGVLTQNQIWDVVNYVRSLGDRAKSAADHSGHGK